MIRQSGLYKWGNTRHHRRTDHRKDGPDIISIHGGEVYFFTPQRAEQRHILSVYYSGDIVSRGTDGKDVYL